MIPEWIDAKNGTDQGSKGTVQIFSQQKQLLKPPKNWYDNGKKQPFEDVFPIKMVIFHCHVSFWGSKSLELLKSFGFYSSLAFISVASPTRSLLACVFPAHLKDICLGNCIHFLKYIGLEHDKQQKKWNHLHSLKRT